MFQRGHRVRLLRYILSLAISGLLTELAAKAQEPQVPLFEAASRQSREISTRSLAQPLSPAEWENSLEQRRSQWLKILGLDPLPDRNEAVILHGIHVQSITAQTRVTSMKTKQRITERHENRDRSTIQVSPEIQK